MHARRSLLLRADTSGPADLVRVGTLGYTLVEILVATTILGLAVSMTMVVWVAALKRAKHTENALQGTAELRYATDVISQAVRSAVNAPTVNAAGTQLTISPKDLGYATVLDTTWLDAAHTTKGTKSTMKVLKVSNSTQPIVTVSLWAGTDRPTGALASGDVATYFTSSLPTTNLADVFSVGDTISIPATAFGNATTGVINSISNNPGNKTITLVNKLGVDVPNGTKISATSGKRVMFEVRSNGDLRYYPDTRDLTKYAVLAHDVTQTPLSDPSTSTSTASVPFTISSTDSDYVLINLQQIPATTTRIGRTLQGVQTAVFTRTSTE